MRREEERTRKWLRMLDAAIQQGHEVRWDDDRVNRVDVDEMRLVIGPTMSIQFGGFWGNLTKRSMKENIVVSQVLSPNKLASMFAQ